MTPEAAPIETVRLLADLDVEWPGGMEPGLADLPEPGRARKSTPRRRDASLDLAVMAAAAAFPAPFSVEDLAQATGRDRPSLSRRIPSVLVEIGKGTWWHPDRVPPPCAEALTLPRNVGERVRAERSIESSGRSFRIRRRP